jgi:hypothetical protein
MVVPPGAEQIEGREPVPRDRLHRTVPAIAGKAPPSGPDWLHPSDPQAYSVNGSPTFIRIRVSPAKAAINSDRAITEKLTGAWLPC